MVRVFPADNFGPKSNVMDRPLIAIARGGYSGESVISHQSAARMLEVLDRSVYDPVLLTIDRSGWSASTPEGEPLVLDRGSLSVDRGSGAEQVRMVLIAIHGSPGEDGRLQGFLDLLGIPYQTGGVLNTSLTFSKHTTTALLRQLGHPVAGSMLLHRDLPMDLPAIAQEVGIPCFVKPDRSGSSLGISRVDSEEALGSAIAKAFDEDDLVLVEAAMKGRELTCGVVQLDGRVIALPLCEVVTSHTFFDFEAKYHAADTQEIVPAPVPEEVARECQERSVRIYRDLDCRGLVRIDHIWGEHGIGTIEVNTTPGFTAASIVPRMLAASDLGEAEVVNGMVKDALRRAGQPSER